MNSKMTTNPQLPTTEPQTKTKQKNLCKQLKQKQNHRNVDHMRGYQWEGRWGRMRKKVGTKWMGRLRIMWEIEKPKNLGTTHGHEPRGWGGILVGVGMQGGGE